MASKKNKNKRRGPASSSQTAPLPKPRDKPSHKKHGQATRETVESLVIAFVLAFLFRTFQAEAFVIPTGSMAPTLMGRHEDVRCSQCGCRFRVSDSEMEPERVHALAMGERKSPQQVISENACVAGQCPNCRFVMPFKPIRGVPESDDVELQKPASGDRILVNKYAYSFTEPRRWDIVVFKYPGDAVRNYIKRLVGLPGEELKIEHGDIFTRTGEGAFEIQRKPADKMLVVRQLVHDTNYDPASLFKAGYPLRWKTGDSGWKVETNADGQLVQQTYRIKPSAKDPWLRYEHTPADASDWDQALSATQPRDFKPAPQLITDYNTYNTAIKARDLQIQRKLFVPDYNLGIHWVGDLYVEADAQIESATGELILELIEAGCRFQCRFDIGTGQATLVAIPFGKSTPSPQVQTTATTRIKGPGKHKLRFANVDDQLLLWVNGKLVEFDNPTTYDAEKLSLGRQNMIPKDSNDEPGDLTPAGIGASNLDATITRLSVWRDIYYIADRSPPEDLRLKNGMVSDFIVPHQTSPFPVGILATEPGLLSISAEPRNVRVRQLLTDPATWDAFRERRSQTFKMDEDNFFVMGDNSAASSDARLWSSGNRDLHSKPGGPYLERSLLIGKAACVYWPHSFNRIPGTPIPLPLFPNFGDMRLVR